MNRHRLLPLTMRFGCRSRWMWYSTSSSPLSLQCDASHPNVNIVSCQMEKPPRRIEKARRCSGGKSCHFSIGRWLGGSGWRESIPSLYAHPDPFSQYECKRCFRISSWRFSRQKAAVRRASRGFGGQVQEGVRNEQPGTYQRVEPRRSLRVMLHRSKDTVLQENRITHLMQRFHVPLPRQKPSARFGHRRDSDWDESVDPGDRLETLLWNCITGNISLPDHKYRALLSLCTCVYIFKS